MNSFTVGDLPEDQYFEKDAMLDKKFLVCVPGVPISETLKKELAAWDFDKIFSEGDVVPDSPILHTPKKQNFDSRLSDELDSLIASAENGGGEAQDAAAPEYGKLNKDEEKVSSVKAEYLKYLRYVESVYSGYMQRKFLSMEDVTAKMKDFCDFMRENKRYVLRIQYEETGQGKTYLATHSLRSTVFAIAIALQLKFPPHKMIELATACILHEIGMVRLPVQLYTSSRPLNQQEKNAITAHPVISYNTLREFSFPLNICLGALEHHEKEDGSGYPRKLAKDQISIYAKIIAVACSYEAVTSKRPFREGKDAYSGIVDILKNQGHRYNSAVVHALLLSLSLYPIGLYVLLSDGRRGQVIDINPENPKYPEVQVCGEYRPDGTPKTVETSEYGVSIARPLTKEEAAAIKN